MDNNPRPLPYGLYPESAEQALNGPVDQRIRELSRIIGELRLWNTTEARELRCEAAGYLHELSWQ